MGASSRTTSSATSKPGDEFEAQSENRIVLLQQLGGGLGQEGFGQPKALDIGATQAGQPHQLIGLFHAFGDRGHAQLLGEGDDRADDRLGVVAAAQLGNEGSIDLQLIHR